MIKQVVKNLLLLFIALFFVVPQCFAEEKTDALEEELNPLVVFYSRSGNTKRVADIVCRKLSVKPAEIKSKVNRQGLIGITNCILDQYLSGRRDKQATLSLNLGKQSVVIVLSPVWMMKLSSPARTFLRDNAGSLNDVYIITTAMRQLPENKIKEIFDSVKLLDVDVKKVFCVGGVAKKTDKELEDAIALIFENISLQVR